MYLCCKSQLPNCSSIISPAAVIFYSFPRRLRGFVEFVLNLVDTISARYQHAREDERIGFVTGFFEFLASLFLELLVPWLAVGVGPVEMLGGPQYLAI